MAERGSGKRELEEGFSDLMRISGNLPSGAGRELVITAISDAQNAIQVMLTPEGTINPDQMILSGKAFRRLRAEPTNGSSWCC